MPNVIEIIPGVKFKESNYGITRTEGTLRILASGENDVTIDGINGLDGRGIVKTYDGQAVAVVAEAAIRENSTVEYSVDDGEWTAQQPTFLNAGTHEVAVRATNPNYETVEKAVTVVVNRAPVTVAAVATSKTAGAADPALTATVSGMVNGEPASLISYTVTRTAGELVGSYQIVPTGLAIQGNYAVTYVPATLTISAAPVVPPTVTPVVPTAPVVTPAAVTPAPAPAAPAAPAPAAPAPAAEPSEDDATPQAAAPAERTPLAETEEIEDEGTPMGAFDEPHCWDHWVMLLGILITAAYTASSSSAAVCIWPTTWTTTRSRCSASDEAPRPCPPTAARPCRDSREGGDPPPLREGKGEIEMRKSNWIVAAIAAVACGVLCGPGSRWASNRWTTAGFGRARRVVARRGRRRRRHRVGRGGARGARRCV